MLPWWADRVLSGLLTVPARVMELTGGKGADVALARFRRLLGGDGVGAQGHMVTMPGLHLASLAS